MSHSGSLQLLLKSLLCHLGYVRLCPGCGARLLPSVLTLVIQDMVFGEPKCGRDTFEIYRKSISLPTGLEYFWQRETAEYTYVCIRQCGATAQVDQRAIY